MGFSFTTRERTFDFFAPLVIAAMVVVAYLNSLSVPLLLDDEQAIVSNPSIRRLTAIGDILSTANATTTAGRPVLNLSFALNYAIGAEDVRGYHAVNLLIHIASALALFGLVRRTLLLPLLAPTSSGSATLIAAVTSASWSLHPIQTEAVTYISQRAESLMGFFYFFTLYCFCRSVGEIQKYRWQTAALFSCGCAMATKESAVTLPLLALLYERAFVSSSFRSIFRERGGYYSALAATWGLLAWLMKSSHLSQVNVGFDQGVSAWSYFCTETKVILNYAWLSQWPNPLIFDYGTDPFVTGFAAVWPAFLLLVLAAIMTGVVWYHSPRAGFLPAAFFILLSPTSSFVPIAQQPMAESRMYLPLSAIFIGGTCLAWRCLGRRTFGCLAVLIGVFTVLTFARNELYREPLQIWRQTVSAIPSNARARVNLGITCSRQGLATEAIVQYQEAIRLDPMGGLAYGNLSEQLFSIGRKREAIEIMRLAIQRQPTFAISHYKLANLLGREQGHETEALLEYQESLRLNPGLLASHGGIVDILVRLDRGDEAKAYCNNVLTSDPRVTGLRRSLADAFVSHGNLGDAAETYRTIVSSPTLDPEIYYNFGVTLHNLGDREAALGNYERALQLNPQHLGALSNLGLIYASLGRFSDAIYCFETALKIKPDFEAARLNLAQLKTTGRP